MDENYLSIKDKLKKKKKLEKLKKKYGPLNNFVKKVVTEKETKTNNEKVNISYLSNKQLKDKLDNVEAKYVPNAKKKTKQK